MPVVMAKPDALTGSASEVSCQRVEGLLLALARYCGHSAAVAPELAESAERAAQQISERAATEPSFAGTPRDCGGCVQDLLALNEHLPRRPLATIKALLISLRGLGFRVTHQTDHLMTIADVDAVYAEEYQQIRPQLIDYLVGNPVRVVWLAGDQHPAALQAWKTYVRHILVSRPATGEHLLRNLVHVCEGPDADHLTRLLNPHLANANEEHTQHG